VSTFADLAARILAAPPRLGPVRLVAVDGHAGAGKSTFARRVAVAVRDTGATVAELHTDDLLEGWGDLDGYWPRLESSVLGPLRRGAAGAYHPYDWLARRFADEVRPVPVTDVLVIEGVASGRSEGRGALSLLVWVDAPEVLRLRRGLARDGESMRAQWLRWMTDETVHFSRERTRDAADVQVNGAPEISPENPDREFAMISGWSDLRH
jgi:uridine kinase